MLNKVTLIGRVGKDPEVRRLESGAAVAKFSLATSETYKDKDGNKQQTTEWHNVVIWRQLAEIVEKYVKKGQLISIEGKVTYREYTDKDNVKKHFTEIIASEMKMLEGRDGGNGSDYGANQAPAQTTQAATPDNVGEPPANDDLPF